MGAGTVSDTAGARVSRAGGALGALVDPGGNTGVATGATLGAIVDGVAGATGSVVVDGFGDAPDN